MAGPTFFTSMTNYSYLEGLTTLKFISLIQYVQNEHYYFYKVRIFQRKTLKDIIFTLITV